MSYIEKMKQCYDIYSKWKGYKGEDLSILEMKENDETQKK